MFLSKFKQLPVVLQRIGNAQIRSRPRRSLASKTSAQKVDGDGMNEKTQTEVMHFFNHCDYVTLNKLVALKPMLLRDVPVIQIASRPHGPTRFESLEALSEMTGIHLKNMPEMRDKIALLKQREAAGHVDFATQAWSLGKQRREDLHKVVVVDVYQHKVAWAEQCTQTRRVLSLGLENVFPDNFKLNFKHDLYHNKIRNIVELIPSNTLFLLNSYGAAKFVLPNRSAKHAIHQTAVEGLFYSMLSMKAQTLHQRDLQQTDGLESVEDFALLKEEQLNTSADMENGSPQTQDSNRTESKPHARVNKTYVHCFDMKKLSSFYDLVVHKEIKSTSTYIQECYDMPDHGPLKGLNFIEDVSRHRRSEFKQNEQVSNCILVADAFSRTVQADSTRFPRSYS